MIYIFFFCLVKGSTNLSVCKIVAAHNAGYMLVCSININTNININKRKYVFDIFLKQKYILFLIKLKKMRI